MGPPATLRDTVTSHLASKPSERRAPFVVLFWIGAANVIGGVVVFLYLNYISEPISDATNPQRLTTSRLVLFLVYGLGSVIIGGIRMIGDLRPIWLWIIRPRALRAQERVAALHLPFSLAREAMAYWLGAMVAFAALNVVEGVSSAEILRVALGIFLGGVSASAFTYLFVEVSLRPVFVRALEGRVFDDSLVLGIRAKLLLSWAMGSGIPMLWIALSPFGRDRQDRELIIDLALLAWVALVTGGSMVYVAAGSVAARLAVVRNAMFRVQEGDLSVDLLVDDGGELGRLQAGFNEMVAGLRQREQLRSLFERHVGDEVARHALETDAGLGGEQREVSVLFIDLIGSTQLASTMKPNELVDMLNTMFSTLVRVVKAEGGSVNKFEGDGALCIFGAPDDQPDHAARALRAARTLRREVALLARDRPQLDVGIGVSSGLAVAANIGSEERYEYTVVGDPVNEASRLTELAKTDPERLLASKTSIDHAGREATFWQRSRTEELRGRHAPTSVYVPAEPSHAATDSSAIRPESR